MKSIKLILTLVLFLFIAQVWGQGTMYLQEDFDGLEVGSIPTGWTASADYWQIRHTNEAGGESPELRFNTSMSGDHSIYTSAIDIASAEDLEMVFFQKSDDLDDPGPYTLSVQVSNNATDWVDVWTVIDPANISQQMTVLSLTDYATWDLIYLKWKFSGDAGDHDNWWIDNITLYEPTAYPGEAQPVYPSDGDLDILAPFSLQWNQGLSADPDGYELYLGTENPPPFIQDIEGDTSYYTGELQYNTVYYWQLIPYNDFGSPENCPIWSFTTGPDPEIVTPAVESFDSVSQPDLPYGWRKIVENPSASAKVVTVRYPSPRSTPNQAQIASTSAAEQNVMLISPPVANLAESRIRFWLKTTYLPNAGAMIIGTMSDPFDSSSFTAFHTVPVSEMSTSFQEFLISFEDYTGTDAYIAFKHAGSAGVSSSLYIDDLSFEELPGTPIITSDVDFIEMLATENATTSDYFIQLSNDGTGTLIIEESDISISGDNAEEFGFSNDSLPISLAQGESAELSLSFSPLSAGEKSAVLLISGNAVNAPYTIELGGIGYPEGTAILGHGIDPETHPTDGPVNIFFKWQRAQMVYTAEEILANGISGSNMLTHFGYYVISAPESPIVNYRIKMKHTAATNVTNHDDNLTDYNEVYFSSLYMPSAGDYDVLQLDTPFGWNGIDNILVEISFGGVESTSSSGINRMYNKPVPNGYRSVRSSTGNITGQFTNQTRNWKPQAIMTFSENAGGPWPSLTNVMKFNETVEYNSTVQKSLVVFNAGDEDLSYSIETSDYPGLVTPSPASGTILPGSSDEISIVFDSAEFEAGEYDFDIIIHHNADTDDIIVPCKVKTLPNNLLVWEDFNNWPPQDWQITSTLAEANWTISNSSAAGGTYPEASFNATPLLLLDGVQRLISPPINTAEFSNIYLEFKHAASTYNNLYQISVQTSTDLENWTVVEDFPNTGFAGNKYSSYIDNEDVGSDTFYVSWTFTGNSFYILYWVLDDIVISGGEDYAEVFGTVTLSNSENPANVTLVLDDQTTSPDAQGNYSFSVFPGTHYLGAYMAGYENMVFRNLELDSGQMLQQDINLQYIEPTLYPATDLSATVQEFNSVQLAWEAPNVQSQEILYHNGYSGAGIGTNTPVEAEFAIRLTSEELDDYVGWELGKVSFMLHTMEFNSALVHIYEGGSNGQPGTLVYEEDVTNKALSQIWIDEILEDPITILPDTEYWIGYYLDATGGYPAACDSGPAVSGKGDLIYTDGSWISISDALGLDVNWIINATLTSPQDRAGNKLMAKSSLEPRAGIRSRIAMPTGLHLNELAIENSLDEIQVPAYRNLYGYTVYRDGTAISNQGPYELDYTDADLDAGTYSYSIEANYTQGNVLNSTPAEIIISLPAPTNLAALVDGGNLNLSWDPPTQQRSIQSYNLYMDEELVENVEGLSYSMADMEAGIYSFNVAAIYSGDHEGEMSQTLEVEIESSANNDLVNPVTGLLGNYPNPFNPSTTIRYSLKEASDVKIVIFNSKGQIVRKLVEAHMDRGNHTAVWNGQDNNGNTVGNGLYLYKMQSPDYQSTKKMILMK